MDRSASRRRPARNARSTCAWRRRPSASRRPRVWTGRSSARTARPAGRIPRRARPPAGASTRSCARPAPVADVSRAGLAMLTCTVIPVGRSVRVSIAKPARETYREEPSLVPLRDSSVTQLVATLANEWKNATRNLGSLQVTDTSADITVFVVAAKGTSVHRRSTGDLSEDIVVYVSDEIGVRSVENTVAVTLHELGHIWCCTGSGTTDGHWTTAEASPGLSGVDKYGLMNHPVMCVVFVASTSCPNRFSDRE